MKLKSDQKCVEMDANEAAPEELAAEEADPATVHLFTHEAKYSSCFSLNKS